MVQFSNALILSLEPRNIYSKLTGSIVYMNFSSCNRGQNPQSFLIWRRLSCYACSKEHLHWGLLSKFTRSFIVNRRYESKNFLLRKSRVVRIRYVSQKLFSCQWAIHSQQKSSPQCMGCFILICTYNSQIMIRNFTYKYFHLPRFSQVH